MPSLLVCLLFSRTLFSHKILPVYLLGLDSPTGEIIPTPEIFLYYLIWPSLEGMKLLSDGANSSFTVRVYRNLKRTSEPENINSCLFIEIFL